MLDIKNPDIIGALLDAQDTHSNVKIYQLHCIEPLHSRVLGFDYYSQTLLIDGFSPPQNQKNLALMKEEAFYLQIKASNGKFLRLTCLLVEEHFDLFTLKILTAEFTLNQRWFQRIQFEPRNGPACKFALKEQLPIEGHIRDLSVHGALVECYGDDLREQFVFSRFCETQIKFNELFELSTTCQLKQIQFSRKPSCHTRIRIGFSHHTSVSYSQVENFINAFEHDLAFDSSAIKSWSNKLQAGAL